MKTKLFFAIFFCCVAMQGAWSGELPVNWYEGKDYVLLREMAKQYRCVAQGPHRNVISLVNKWLTITFKTDSREALINGTLVWLHEPLQQVKGRWALRAVDARKVIDPVVRPSEYMRGKNCRVIVLDPGHGGQDTGAKGARGLEEKRLVLDVARRMRTHLSNAGFIVYLTRESDRFIELDERCRKAKNWDADLFVSIHFNSAGNEEACGTETYALTSAGYASTSGGESAAMLPGNKQDAANSLLAYGIQRALASKLGRGDRGVKRARFLVLKNAPCPAALVECAFVSNKKEEEALLQDQFRESIALGITRGILNYVSTIRRANLGE